MLNCKQTVEIVSSQVQPNWWMRIQVSLHILMCRHCRKYVKHLKLIKSGFQKLISDRIKDADPKKIESLETSVIQKNKN